MQTIKITKSIVDKLPYSNKGQDFYRDKELKGFGLYIGAQSKTYYAERRVEGKTVRYKLGRHGDITSETARNLAKSAIGDMVKGCNLNEGKKVQKAHGVTLKQAYTKYRNEKKSLKRKTLYDYDRIIEVVFKNWEHKPLARITGGMVTAKFKKIGDENGHAYANLSFRFLRALFNFAKSQYKDSKGQSIILENPVNQISGGGGWYKIKRRQTVIQPEELSDWFKSVIAISNEHLKFYLIFLLFTGLRRQEAATLKCEQVNSKAKTITIHDTKNSETLTLPLSTHIWGLLAEKRKSASSDFVFPGTGITGHLIEPRSAIKFVTENSGVKFKIHDLRRTFISISSSLVSAYELKLLVNHKMDDDITGGYIVPNTEQLRKCSNKISNHLLKLIKKNKSGKIIQHPSAKNN
jgi:integrase